MKHQHKHAGKQQRKVRDTRPSKLTPKIIEMVRTYYMENKASYQKHLQHFLATKGIIISKSSVQRAIKMANFTRKRLSSHVLGEQTPEKVQKFYNEIQPLIEQKEENIIVSTDESYFSEKVIPRHAYSLIGCKPKLTKINKSGGWKQRSLIQSVASDGTKYYEIQQGPVKRKRFAEYIQNLPYPRGSVILMDNCTIHKSLESIFDQLAETRLAGPTRLVYSSCRSPRRSWLFGDKTLGLVTSGLAFADQD